MTEPYPSPDPTFPDPASPDPASPDPASPYDGSSYAGYADPIQTLSRRRRSISVTHLVFGVVFAGTAVAWWLHQAGVIEADGFRWVFPLVLILAGGAGLVASVARSIQRERATRD